MSLTIAFADSKNVPETASTFINNKWFNNCKEYNAYILDNYDDNTKASLNMDLLQMVKEMIENLKEDGKYDPLDLGERHLLINDSNLDNISIWSFQIRCSNIKGDLKGLLGVVPKIVLLNILFKYESEMEFPEIHFDIKNYNFEGFLGLKKIFGDGKLIYKNSNL